MTQQKLNYPEMHFTRLQQCVLVTFIQVPVYVRQQSTFATLKNIATMRPRYIYSSPCKLLKTAGIYKRIKEEK
ncbi:hypothetical protein QE152_g10894 [Popillia japonica]|uniref:Uncharacterized protein n=1 Tax=Popillia japonica TaxID=7064 RepID=A0AAW1LPF9_POPJA